ncbi:MAG: MBL fold metallo-hydrolase [Euryarchaeota archaeon]|nr:MBL fold metallo-hydrolase [Euryarchaeota archaeon]
MGTARIEIHVLASGSDGNCSVVVGDGTTIMVDAGLSRSATERLLNKAGLDPRSIDAVLLTHEHSDHAKGASLLSRKYGMPIMGNMPTLHAAGVQSLANRIIFETSSAFRIGGMEIEALPTSHEAAEPVAFSFTAGNRKAVIATDLGTVTPIISSALKAADLAMLEANHDLDMLLGGPYPPFLKRLIMSDRGHLSNVDCAAALGANHRHSGKIILAHLSRNNNTPLIAKETVARALGCSAESINCLWSPGEILSVSSR